MKKNLLLKITSALLVFFAIASCQSDTRTLSEQKKEPVDSEIQNDSLPAPVFGDEQLENEPFDMYACYPLSSMYIFEYPVGNAYFDELWRTYKTNSYSVVTQEKDVCLGDYCQSYEKLINDAAKLEIYFFKGESGEYGFGNSQFVFRNDSLVFKRDFSVSIEVFPTDSTTTVWGIKEMVTRVDAKKANQQRKEAKTDDLASFDYKMRNVVSTKSSRSYTQWSKVSKEELKQNVQLKKKAVKYN